MTGPSRAASAALVVLLAAATPQALGANPPPPVAPRAAAEIALLGGAAAVGPVRDVLSELLAREGIAALWTWPERLRPEEILSPREESQRPAIAVWIDLTSPVEARLYFRDAGARRFVVRRISLRHGSEEIAREEIAHIVASAVLALNAGNSAATLSRSQARAAIASMPDVTAAPGPRRGEGNESDHARDAGPADADAVAADAADTVAADADAVAADGAVAEPVRPTRRGRATPLVWEVGGSFALQTLAREIPIAPRFDLSIGAVERSIGAWLSAGYQFPASDSGGSVGVTLRAVAVRAGLLWDVWNFGASSLRVWTGVGVDHVEFRPRSDDPAVELAPAGRFWTPTGRLAVGIRFHRWRHLALEGGLVGDLSLADVHFDLHDAQGFSRRVVAPLVLRPGIATGAVWRF